MLLVFPAVVEKCLLYTFQLLVLSPGSEYLSQWASLPLQFHSLPAYRQQVAVLLLFYGHVVALGHLCLFHEKEMIIFGESKFFRMYWLV